jgi:protein TonB
MLAILLLAQAASAESVVTPPTLVPPPPPALPIQIGEGAFNPRAPKPMSYPGSWVMTADYPADSLRANEQGTTGFTVTVDTQGRVKDCRISASSGSPRLDETTCRLVTQRARFTPATDSKDNPIEGTYANRVRWVLPAITPPEPGQAVTTYTVQANGDVTDCKVVLEGAAATSMNRLAGFCGNTKKMKPYLDADKKPVTRKVTMTTTIAVE